ncbi:MAG TPA: class I tRNA ligase family protein, partial [Methanocorpusculum sp.]|nr:class I tRNA ligase family protein [Methanocorpusculum sp.]
TLPQKKCDCGCEEFIPEKAVMDTWATSAVTPLINRKFGEPNEKSFLQPMSMRCHAHEIIRTWTFYTIVKHLYHIGDIPWENLMISGFVLAKSGEKISKSKNNAAFSPTELLKNYGADMIRYWSASNKLGTDTFFDIKELDISKRFLTKLWNFAKFTELQLQDFSPENVETYEPIDLWILSRCHETFEKYSNAMEDYEIGLARQEIDNFFWKDLCDYYLEIVKERLYNKDNKFSPAAQKSAQHTLFNVALEVLKMYSPFVPHITEFIFQEVFAQKTAIKFLSTATFGTLPYEAQNLKFGEFVKMVIGEVRKFKTEKNFSMKEALDALKISTSRENLSLLEKSAEDIKSCTHAAVLTLVEDEDNVVIEKR